MTPNGNLYVTGIITHTFDTDPDSAIYSPVTNTTGHDQTFVEKINSSGKQEWIHIFAGTGDVSANALCLTGAEDVLVGGHYEGSVDFDPGSGVANRTNTYTQEQAFFLRLDDDGDFQEAMVINGNGRSVVSDVINAGNGGFYAAGVYEGNIDCDPGSGHAYPANPTHEGYYIVKIDTGGSLSWANFTVNDPTFDPRFAWTLYLHETVSKDVLVAGGFIGSLMDLNPWVAGGDTLYGSFSTPTTDSDIFLLRYDSTGALKHGQRWGGADTDRANGVFEGADKDVYVMGEIGWYAFEDPGYKKFWYCWGGKDGFILKLDTCPSLKYYGHVNVEACGKYRLRSGVYIYSDTTVFFDTVPSSGGCDSALRPLDIVIYSMPTEVVSMPTYLEWKYANSSSMLADYEVSWYNCDGDSVMTTGSLPAYYPQQPGNYSMILYDRNRQCYDTSACFLINQIELPETSLPSGIAVFPNPTTGKLSIHGLAEPAESLTLRDMTGRKIMQVRHAETIDLSMLAPGTYLLEVRTNKGRATTRIVKR